MNLPGLTGLRFLAAFYVFIFHFDQRIPLTFLPWQLQNLVHVGALGVNVFFVLSGFILTYGYHQRKISYRDFVFKRFFRLYPVYITGLLLSLFISSYFGPAAPVPSVVANAVMFQSFFYPIAMDWYGMAWSVSTEMFFYMLFPLLLPVFLQIKSREALLILLAGLTVISSLPGLLYQFGLLSFELVYTFPLMRLPEFMAGMLLALLTFRYKLRFNPWLALPVFAFSVLYLVYFSGDYVSFVIHNIFFLPSVILLLNLLLHHFKWVGSKPMEYLGQISYSFYIMQLPLMMLLDVLLDSGLNQNPWLLPGVLVINLILAALTYEGIEKPVHQRVKTTIKVF